MACGEVCPSPYGDFISSISVRAIAEWKWVYGSFVED